MAQSPEPLEAEGQEDPTRSYVIREHKLDKYIAYQERTLALYSQLLTDLARSESQDGGAGQATVTLIRRHADAQDKIRRELGLTQRDVEEMERIVGDIISRRAVAPRSEQDESLRQMEALAAKLPAEERAEFDRTIAVLKKQHEDARALVDERMKYGDENVDLVLTREKDLTRQWNQAIATFAGSKVGEKKAAPRPVMPDGGQPVRAAPAADAGAR